MSEESQEFDEQLRNAAIRLAEDNEKEYPTSKEYHEDEYRAGVL